MVDKYYPQSAVDRIVNLTQLTEAEVFQILEQNRSEMAFVLQYVTANAGATGVTKQDIKDNWTPPPAPGNADAIIGVCWGARLIVVVDDGS